MRFEIEKPKLPKGISYVLKTSVLKEAIESLDFDLNIHLIYQTSKMLSDGESILECFYWLPNENVDYDRFYLRAGTVNSESRKIAEIKLKEIVIPKFINWIIKIKSLPSDSTKLKNNLYFNSYFKDEQVKVFFDDL